jgi:hypothetical protein
MLSYRCIVADPCRHGGDPIVDVMEPEPRNRAMSLL